MALEIDGLHAKLNKRFGNALNLLLHCMKAAEQWLVESDGWIIWHSTNSKLALDDDKGRQMGEMRLTIERDGQPLLWCGSGDNALVPTDRTERAAACELLFDALALLAGVSRSDASVARAAGSDARSEASERCPSDHRGAADARPSVRQDSPAAE